jgi:hypothetical protein
LRKSELSASTFGTTTQTAVQQFQVAHNNTGVVDKNTATAINAAVDALPKFKVQGLVAYSGSASEPQANRMEITAQPGTRQWLKQYEAKPTNEPGRYAIPADELSAFNKRVLRIKTHPLKSR